MQIFESKVKSIKFKS